jgi:uncharacterized protein YecT (DUF1311 family)
MNRLVVAVLFSFVATYASCQSKESPETPMTQSEMNRGAGEEASDADAELNRVYQQLLSTMKSDANAAKKLRAAQRAWIAFRDAQLEALYPAEDKRVEYGSMYPMCSARVVAAMTEERTAQLRKMLNEDPCENP